MAAADEGPVLRIKPDKRGVREFTRRDEHPPVRSIQGTAPKPLAIGSVKAAGIDGPPHWRLFFTPQSRWCGRQEKRDGEQSR